MQSQARQEIIAVLQLIYPHVDMLTSIPDILDDQVTEPDCCHRPWIRQVGALKNSILNSEKEI